MVTEDEKRTFLLLLSASSFTRHGRIEVRHVRHEGGGTYGPLTDAWRGGFSPQLWPHLYNSCLPPIILTAGTLPSLWVTVLRMEMGWKDQEGKKRSLAYSLTLQPFILQHSIWRENSVQRQLKSWKQYYCGMWTWDWRETTVSILELHDSSLLKARPANSIIPK